MYTSELKEREKEPSKALIDSFKEVVVQIIVELCSDFSLDTGMSKQRHKYALHITSNTQN